MQFIDETVSLHIAASIPEDEGDYTIKAVNERGVATSAAGVLVNLQAPNFTQPLSDVSVDVSETALLTCTVIGKPEPTIVWLANQTIIDESEKYHIRRDGVTAILEVTSVSEEDSNVVFTCKAQNVAGETSCKAELLVQGIFV